MFSAKNTILFTLIAMNLIDQPAPVVKIEQGFVSGKINSDGKVLEYVGIPYATTRGRFQAPLPAPTWNGVYKAVLDHYQCAQPMDFGFIGSEDCLKINVYVPAFAGTPLPVMVYIHGGAFTLGSGGKMIHGPEFLVKHDVILVTFNYRLGALGFLCLGIEEAPGNAGLKDQVAALRWVKRNIAAFGGDPDNVTIFGHSAGAASTALLVLSDATNELFNRAMIQSGSAINFWSGLDGVELASSVAEVFGYKTRDPKELYDIFSKIPLKDLIMVASGKPFLHLARSHRIFCPCVEKQFPGIEAVFTELPIEVIRKKPKNVSVIYGSNNREGLFLIAEETEESLKELNRELYDFPDLESHHHHQSSKMEAEAVAKNVRQFYLGAKDASNETIESLLQLYGDIYFDIPMLIESELMIQIIKKCEST